MTTITNQVHLSRIVKEVVRGQRVTDVHTHLYPSSFGDILLWGMDELLTYHYLVAEVMRSSNIGFDDFWEMGKQEQADLIWKHLFLDRSPISEACRGVLTTLRQFGLNVRTRDLNVHREFFQQRTTEEQVNKVLELSKADHVVMTNDPFDDKERQMWLDKGNTDPRFHAALRIDPLLNDYPNTRLKLRDWGYQVEEQWSEITIQEINRFLKEWIRCMNPVYVAVSLPPTFDFPEDSDRGRIIRDCILPVTREKRIPFAMMIGVKKKVNPNLGDAGDYVGKTDMKSLEYLLANYPHNKFFVTMLSRENQHELVVLARKFRNLMPFGCWWFMNNPSIVDEITRMRFEMLGTSVVPQHSDARVLEHLLYKWNHSKQVIADVLIDKYNDILATGWQIERSEIERDVEDLFHNNFWRFAERNV